MSYSYEDSGGDWNSHTFPYNLSTFTASHNVHPDLPSEPPGYDEFEFSFPSELSPSLFSLPFMTEKGHGILSPTGSSFPALSSTGHSPTPWADQFLIKSPATIAGPSTSVSHGQHQRQDSAVIAKKLFEDDERSALDAFFNKTLDEAAKPEENHVQEGSLQEQASASPGTGDASLEDKPPATVVKEPRKRSRKQTETLKNVKAAPIARSSKAKRPSLTTAQKKDTAVAGKLEAEEDGLEIAEGQASAKRSRTDSIPNVVPTQSTDPTGLAANLANSKRTSHIASEQKRRSTIKDNYKTLVDMLLAGESTSGISLLGGGEDDEAAESGTKKSKPKGRGRGRKGQDGAGATKSVVLERAADYLRWLDSGNQELEKEINRLELIVAK